MASVLQKGISIVRNKDKDAITDRATNSPRLQQQKPVAAAPQTQSSATSSSNNELLISLEDLKKWTDSFDRLMESQTGRRLFREYLKSEYSEENLLFWEACNELRKEQNKEKVPEKARQIYENYISILSPKEVSLDAQVREIINKNMVAPTAQAFDEAQLQIYTLMHRDSYPRFLGSQLFKKISTNAVELDEKNKGNSAFAALNSAHSSSSGSGSCVSVSGSGSVSGGTGSACHTPSNSHKKTMSIKEKSKQKDKRDKDKDHEDHMASPCRNHRQ